MKKKTLGALCCACLLFLSAPQSAEASWYWIHPGDHVFDAKRFADSIKETAETVKNVMQTLAKVQNQLKSLVSLGLIQLRMPYFISLFVTKILKLYLYLICRMGKKLS